MRSILATLKAEHATLRGLFEQMDATSDRAEKRRAELLEKIESVLIPHAKWEEFVFYPAFAERASHVVGRFAAVHDGVGDVHWIRSEKSEDFTECVSDPTESTSTPSMA